jgi:cytochrome c peroxidase
MEVCTARPSPTFAVGGINTRQVEPRNTPTMINAIFNYRNFWDGRANNIFNGRNPFGPRDPSAGIDPENSVLVADSFGRLSPLKVALADASAASQAVGPPGSDLEMSCRGRVFEEIGKKLLRTTPLLGQTVSTTESVLGPYATNSGLAISYDLLIKKAFPSKFWAGTQLSVDGYRQIEKNFSLFWGIAIMMYESTLVSDDAPFDRYAAGDISALTAQQAHGFQVFNGNGGCIFCHDGPEFTSAASSFKLLAQTGAGVEHMLMGDGNPAVYDSGFYNIGVRPTAEDLGTGATDPWGNPLSFSRETKNAITPGVSITSMFNIGPDGFNVFTCNMQVLPCAPLASNTRDAVDGSFKVPSLRNVELTGPYFHNGGQATLEQVVDFYNRGGDGAGTDFANTTRFGVNPTNRAPAIQPLHLSADDKAAIVAFLKSLTDERVRWEKAPFDHPSLTIPNGHPNTELTVKKNSATGAAIDDVMIIPAVGAGGRSAAHLPAITSFDSTLPLK